MKRTIFAGLFFLLSLPIVLAGDNPTPSPEEIIDRFVAKETEFAELWQHYTYTQKILFQVLGPSGRAREERHVTVEVLFDRQGKRETRTLDDRGRLLSVQVTPEDLSDAISMQPFVLTREQRPDYRIEYLGKETVDELNLYVFDISPEKQRKGKRYFEGKIWVDDLDFQIVMTRGKIVPDIGNNKFPRFETRREQIDGEHWFPTWTEADDILTFGNFMRGRNEVHIRQLITYEDFKKFEVGTSITYGPEAVP